MNFEQLVQPVVRKIRYRNAIYQGQMVYHLVSQKDLRHGEGVLLLHDGTTIVGHWQHGKLEGETIVFSPEGGLIYCEFVADRPHGWMVYGYQQRYLSCDLFHFGKPAEDRYKYETELNTWVHTYKHQSKTEICNYGKIPSMISSEHLQTKLARFFRKEYNLLLDHMHIVKTDQLLYIGFVDRMDRPEGLGIIHS